MTLKSSYAKKEEIPASVLEHYKEEGGQWVLETDGADRLKEFRENNIRLTKEMEKYKDVDPEQYKNLLAEKQENERKQLESKGKYDEALNSQRLAMEAKHKKEMDDATTESKKFQTRLEKVLIADAVASAAVAKGVRSSALTDVKNRASAMFKLDGEEVKAFTDGKEVFGADGKPLSIEAWMDKLLTEAPHLFDDSKGQGARKSEVTGHSGPNPYAAATLNRTTQAKLERDNPQLAKKLQSAAGA